MEHTNIGNLLIFISFILFLLSLATFIQNWIQDIKTISWKDFKNLVKKSVRAIYKMSAKIIDFYKQHREEILSVSLFLLRCIQKIIIDFHACLNGDDTREYMVDTSLILVEEDIVELSKRLDGRPYDTTTFFGWANNFGVARYEYYTCGLTEKYKSLEMKELTKICLYQIRNYYIETRRVTPYVVIEIATPMRLRFAVALSKYGQDLLERQKNALPHVTERPAAILEEEVIDVEKHEKCR